MEEGNPMIH